jgi:hypothetical protein
MQHFWRRAERLRASLDSRDITLPPVRPVHIALTPRSFKRRRVVARRSRVGVEKGMRPHPALWFGGIALGAR